MLGILLILLIALHLPLLSLLFDKLVDLQLFLEIVLIVVFQ